MDLAQIKKTLDSQSGKELKNFIISELRKLNSLSSLKDLDDPEELAIEVKASKKAFDKLVDMFSQILSFEKEDKGRDSKDNYYSL